MLTLRKRGDRVWWAYWRDAEHRQRFRSTRQEDYSKAMRAAAFLVIEDTAALAPVEDKPRRDAAIADVVGWYQEFMASPPHNLQERRPAPQTAVRYMRNATRLAKLAKVVTVADLQAVAPSLNAAFLKLTEPAYVTVLRAVGAGLFSETFLLWLKTEKKVELSNPLVANVPPVRRPEPFYAWDAARLNQLKQSARDTLRGPEPNGYLLFLLCLGAGLRRSEATFLRWEDITDVGVRVTWRSSRQVKSNTSARTIPLDPKLLEEIRAFQESAKPTDFVIPDGEIHNRSPVKYGAPQLRAERACRRLMVWLRANGINMRNPLHHLRRLCGSNWEREFGLRQASYWLGHADVVVTSRHYIGLRAEAVAGW